VSNKYVFALECFRIEYLSIFSLFFYKIKFCTVHERFTCIWEVNQINLQKHHITTDSEHFLGNKIVIKTKIREKHSIKFVS
jgi:hypothetical protein